MNGLAVLVVEEEYLIAADIEQMLLSEGAGRVEIFRQVGDVEPALLGQGIFRLAVIEAKLGAPHVVAFAKLLQDRGIAVVVTSADRAVASLFTGSVPLEKPFDSAALLEACEMAMLNTSPSPQSA